MIEGLTVRAINPNVIASGDVSNVTAEQNVYAFGTVGPDNIAVLSLAAGTEFMAETDYAGVGDGYYGLKVRVKEVSRVTIGSLYI